MPRRRRWFHAAVLTAALAAAGVTAAPGAALAESNGGTRVMPLGDSITEGTQVPGGYRIGLWQRMAAAGYRVDLVGSQFNGPAALGDHDHEGHPGWRIDQIDAAIGGWLRTSTPRTVLLHIGTNDILQNYQVAGAPGRLSTLIDHITAAAPAADVFVATIIPLANAGQEAAARTFNASLPGIVQAKASAGKRVHLVDMHAALSTADLIDGVHPTAGGYDRMAAAWYTALRTVPGTIGDPGAATGRTLVGSGSGRCLDVPGGNSANGTQPIIWDCSGAANQQWTFDGQTLRALGKCLDSPTGAVAGARAQLWDCSGAANQRWTFSSGGTIRNAQSGLCLDVTGNATANGTAVALWTCTGAPNQLWTTR
ncbi:RICIN domain-containing protein [Actinoplanes teichomyceticus]|uniref:Lysophospholipase L1-like esterase n=1 Tax=Actinoplanes teichomyceticus TaxID=1867 RepID=A0A561VM67_ACTTI|nr:ricin-type beta-trefoil lectin domain protein [Actinoplanes teichomyceticus]TWG12705.1 lysophospholipase L1-like esterase [Actinoplanes teichomyceticus]GIF13438.1 lipase [Actinoplanes teichomyceticus]